jgi:hypothetical protein
MFDELLKKTEDVSLNEKKDIFEQELDYENEGYAIVRDDDNVTIYRPESFEAAQELGRGTNWPIMQHQHQWDVHYRRGTKYYILVAKSDKEPGKLFADEAKYLIQVEPTGKKMWYDSNNKLLGDDTVAELRQRIRV